MPAPAPPPVPRPARSRRRLLAPLLGLVFLGAAVFWAGVALRLWGRGTGRGPGEQGETRRLWVRALDPAGAPVRGFDVRSRYGGTWQHPDAEGAAGEASVPLAALPLAPRRGSEAEALADALEARAAYAVARRGRRPEVREEGGRLAVTFHLEPCGLLTVLVPQTGFREVRAWVDPDAGPERWRLLEGREVVRGGEGATWAVFADASEVGLTLEGEQGVARQRLVVRAPSPGHRVEHTLFPRPAQPIAGRVVVGEGPFPPSFAGVLRVRELPPQGPPIEHPAVRITGDGAFEVQYAGDGRYELVPEVGFAAPGMRLEAVGGDRGLELPLRALPWLEVAQSDLGPPGVVPRVALFPEGGGASVVPEHGVLSQPSRLAVAVPGPGRHRLVLSLPGSDDAPPRAGEAAVDVPDAGGTLVPFSLAPRPHGTVEVRCAQVPARGGDVTLLPERTRTWLQGFPGRAAFPHVSPGQAYVLVRWRDPALAADLLTGEVAEGRTLGLEARAEPGGTLRLDLAGTPAARSPEAWALRLAAGATPYGAAEGTLPLAREGASDVFAGLFALRPGAYAGEVHPRTLGGGAALPVRFTITVGASTLVKAAAP